MTLAEKQILFWEYFCRLQIWGIEVHGLRIMEAEGFRTREQAELHVANGTGILNSLHRKKLAHDIWLYDANWKHAWNHPGYGLLGTKWKTMHELARWGGDFGGRDEYHFSFTHGGVS